MYDKKNWDSIHRLRILKKQKDENEEYERIVINELFEKQMSMFPYFSRKIEYEYYNLLNYLITINNKYIDKAIIIIIGSKEYIHQKDFLNRLKEMNL